jgi:hypothetical protein
MPLKKSNRNKGSTGPQNTGSSQGGAAAAVVAEPEQPNVPRRALVEKSPLANPAVVEPQCEEATQGSLLSDQNGVPPSQSGNDSVGCGATQKSLTSGQNDVPPSQSGNDSEDDDDDWLDKDVSSIKVPEQKCNLPECFTKISNPRDVKPVQEPNIFGPPVSIPLPESVYIPPDLLLKISAIIDQIFSQSGVSSTKPTAGGGGEVRFIFSGNQREIVKMLLFSLGFVNRHDFNHEEVANKSTFFLATPNSTDAPLHRCLVEVIGSLPDVQITFAELSNLVLSPEYSQMVSSTKKKFTIEFLNELLKLNPVVGTRFNQIITFFMSYINQRAQENADQDNGCWNSVLRMILIPFLEYVNRENFTKMTSSSLKKLAIDMLRTASNLIDNQPDIFTTNQPKTESLQSNPRSMKSKGSSTRDLLWMNILGVCSIIRVLHKKYSEFPLDLFWELTIFAQENQTMEHIRGLCFDHSREFQKALKDVIQIQKPLHASKTAPVSEKMMSVNDCMNSIKPGGNLIDVTDTGGGKTTCYMSAHVILAAKCKSSIVFIGPNNHASTTMIIAICMTVAEKMGVNIIPVTGPVAPKNFSSTKSEIVYVFILSSMNDFSAVMSFFGEDQCVRVMIDDNEEFGNDMLRGLDTLLLFKQVTQVTMCGASYDASSFKPSQNVDVKGLNTVSLSSVSSFGMVCHEIHLSMCQMIEIRRIVSENIEFAKRNSSLLRKILELFRTIAGTEESELDLSEMLKDLEVCYFDLFAKSLSTKKQLRLRTANENDNDFFMRILPEVLRFFLLHFKYKINSFEELYQQLLLLENPEGFCPFNYFDIAKRMLPLIEKYVNVFNEEEAIFCPDLPSTIVDVESLKVFDEKYKKILSVLSSSDFFLPDRLQFPKKQDGLNFDDKLCGSNGSNSHTVCIVGRKTDPWEIAIKLMDRNLVEFASIRMKSLSEEKDSNCSNSHVSKKKGQVVNQNGDQTTTGNSTRGFHTESQSSVPKKDSSKYSSIVSTNDGSTTSSTELDDSEKFDSVDMSKTHESQMSDFMSLFDRLRKDISANAPLATKDDANYFANFLVKMKTPMASIIFRCFVLGVLVPTEEMGEQITDLIIKLFQEGRLCLVIKEGLWNFMSRNFTLSYTTYIICLSEVSSKFFKQNIFGRFERVGCNQSSAFVMCFTPSGRIVDDRPSVEESNLQKQMVSLQDLSQLVPNLSQVLVSLIVRFVNGCFNLDPKEVGFILELMRMSDLAIHDERFKYACHGNQYSYFLRLMSSYLVSQHCDLGDTKTPVMMKIEEIGELMSSFLLKLAINERSRLDFQYLATKSTELDVRNFFLEAIFEMMPNHSHLSTARILSIALDNDKMLWMNQSDLVKLWFNIRRLMKLVKIVEAFFTNVWSSNTMKGENPEIRAILTVVREVNETIERLSCIIASKIDQHFFMKDLVSSSVEKPVVVAQNPLEKLKCDLQGCPLQTIKGYSLILRAFSKQFPDYAAIFDKFKEECKIFGNDCVVRCELLELKRDPTLSQAGLNECDSQIMEIRESMEKLTGHPALKTKKRLEFNAKLEEQNAIRLDIERKISLMAEHEASLTKYEGMSEEQFLAHFLSENFY